VHSSVQQVLVAASDLFGKSKPADQSYLNGPHLILENIITHLRTAHLSRHRIIPRILSIYSFIAVIKLSQPDAIKLVAPGKENQSSDKTRPARKSQTDQEHFLALQPQP
jgi:hypothetical protein